MKTPSAVMLALLMATCSLSGCFGVDETEEETAPTIVWDFEKEPLTWYHLPGGVDAWGNDEIVFEGRNVPHPASGTY